MSDLSLQDYISKKNVYLPHTAGRWNKRRFRKVLELHMASSVQYFLLGCNVTDRVKNSPANSPHATRP